MNLAIEIVLGLYGIGATVALVVLYKRVEGSSPTSILWYEKSISAIGVIAFFSMTIAAGIQTIKGAIDDLKLERAKSDLSALEEEKQSMQVLIARLSRATLSQIQESGTVDRTSRELLHQRLETLMAAPTLTKEEVLEAFDIALILRDYEAAKELTAQHKDLLHEASPGNQLALAEFLFLGGSKYAAKDIVTSLVPLSPTLPKPWQVRIIVLEARIDGNPDKYVQPLADLLQIGPQLAKVRLEQEISSDTSAAVPAPN